MNKLKQLILVTILVVLFQPNRLQANTSSQHWGKSNQVGIGYFLSGQYDLFYSHFFKLVLDPKEQALARQSAEENLFAAYHKGITPKLVTTPYNRVIDAVTIVNSINQEQGAGLNYSLDFEIQSHKLNTLTSLTLSHRFQPIIKMKGNEFSKITNLHKIWLGRYTGLQEPLSSGVYSISIEYDNQVEQFDFLLDEFNQNNKLPPFPKIIKSANQEHLVKWENYKSNAFLENRDKQKVILTTIKEGEVKATWHEERLPSSTNEAKFIVDLIDKTPINFGINYVEIHTWGRLQLLNAINYRIPILTK